MKIYHYHPEHNHYLFSDFADQSPLDPPGVWLIPAHATEIEPEECNPGEIQIFNGSSWDIIEDKRGTYYSTETREETENYNPHSSPENSTKEKPPEVLPNQILKWEDGWVLEDIPELTPEQKLERSGLTVNELKQLLGLA